MLNTSRTLAWWQVDFWFDKFNFSKKKNLGDPAESMSLVGARIAGWGMSQVQDPGRPVCQPVAREALSLPAVGVRLSTRLPPCQVGKLGSSPSVLVATALDAAVRPSPPT